jgi:hypothetical protein
MSFELHQDKHQFPAPYAATGFTPRNAVVLTGTNALYAAPCATSADRPWGVTGAATYATGESIVVYFGQNIVKMRSAASVGVAQDVCVASVNGAVGASGIITASAHWIVGQTLTAAGAGDIVSVFINPRKA